MPRKKVEQKVEQYYKMATVLKVTGIKRSKMDTWVFKGMVIPAEPAIGSGYSSKYSVANMVQLSVIDRLARAGVKLITATEIAKGCVQNPDSKCYLDLEAPEKHSFNLKGPLHHVDFTLIIDTPSIFTGIEEDIRDLGD